VEARGVERGVSVATASQESTVQAWVLVAERQVFSRGAEDKDGYMLPRKVSGREKCGVVAGGASR
jgi:hypothetical protein